MAFTTPGTAVAGEVLTAAFWNEQVRDNIANLRALANVKSTLKTDTFTASTGQGVYAAVTGLEVTITPTSATSKILVLAHMSGSSLFYRVKRDSTLVGVGNVAGSRSRVSSGFGSPGAEEIGGSGVVFIDSPATTSSITYSVEIGHGALSSVTMFVNLSSGEIDRNDMARGTSGITVMEVPA
jgi:hypothetical protein